MNDAVKAWVAALRSGDYKQTTGQLNKTVLDEQRFCCLGVLCDIQGRKWYQRGRSFHVLGRKFNETKAHRTMPPATALAQVGVSTMFAKELARKNDDGRDFNWIANFIETRIG